MPILSRRRDAVPTTPHVHDEFCGCSRRQALASALGCGGYVLFALAGLTALERKAFAAPTGTPVTTEKFARIEKIADGVWAVVSTPFDDPQNLQPQTLSNGGIIAGSDGVLVVEGFNQTVGSAWVADMAKQLTGRAPTHVVVTHFHADHTAGLAGFQQGASGPDIVATKVTRDLTLERYTTPRPPREGQAAPDIAPTFARIVTPNRIITDTSKPVSIDLGGRKVTLVPRDGHTDSDVTIELEDPRVVFCGDLYFNKIFPNYSDSTPSRWNTTLEAMLKQPDTLWVPGHGSLSHIEDLKTYVEMLKSVETAARDAHKAGKPADVAGGEFTIPSRLGEWYKFNPRIFVVAFDAWYRELGAKKG